MDQQQRYSVPPAAAAGAAPAGGYREDGVVSSQDSGEAVTSGGSTTATMMPQSSMPQGFTTLSFQHQALFRSLTHNPSSIMSAVQSGPPKMLLPKGLLIKQVDPTHPDVVALPPGVPSPVGQQQQHKVVVAPLAVPLPPSRGRSQSRSSDGGGGGGNSGPSAAKPRKPCNCKNSQCLKLYCDCFANGEFCRDNCNCHNCKNSMQHEDDRSKAVKSCLDRNPNAFKPKVGQSRTGAGDERRHIKGCNCRKSSCLKNYCECYEAKIPCSSLCRCVGCQNLPDRPEGKSLMQLADAADIRTQQQKAASSHFLEQLQGSSSTATAAAAGSHYPVAAAAAAGGHKLPYAFVNKEVAKATALCLLEEASHAAMTGKSADQVQNAVLVEFGNCLEQIIAASENANQIAAARPALMSRH